jgi:Xaa-Pro dipeptidase
MTVATTWAPTPFPVEVHAERLARMRERCEQRGLDGMLLMAQESLYYLLGYDQIGYWVFHAFWVPAGEGPVVAVCRAPDADTIAQSPFVDDVQVWTDDQADSPAVQVTAILEGAGARRVGVELTTHALVATHWSALQEAARGRVELVDASDLVPALRVVKDELEIECFRRAAGHLERSYAALEETLAPGVRECDLLAASLDAMYRDGAGPTAIHPPIASGPRTMTQTHGSATQREIREGEPVVAEIGAASARYHAVAARSYVLGQPPAQLERLHEAAAAALDAGFAAFEPGRPLSDVARLAQAEVTARGYTRAGRHVGYGTGIGYPPTWLDQVRIKVSDPTEAVPGMTLFYFVGLTDPDAQMCVYVGEPVLITAGGYERPAPYDPAGWRR